MWKGLIVGLLGAGLWFGMLLTPLHTSDWIFIDHCPPASVSPDCGYMMFIPLFFGPPAGVVISTYLSRWIDRASPQKFPLNDRSTAFMFAAARYGAVLGVLWLLSLVPYVVREIPDPLMVAGLDWAGPLPIILWSLIGGAVHASLWKAPDRQSVGHVP
jgi:hypothetical protein